MRGLRARSMRASVTPTMRAPHTLQTCQRPSRARRTACSGTSTRSVRREALRAASAAWRSRHADSAPGTPSARAWAIALG